MADDVANNEIATPPKKLGGITGKGFVPGRSGNPNGRPKSIIGKALLKRLKENDHEKLKLVVEGILGSAEKGDAKAFSAIFDRIDGKPTQPIEADVNLNISLAEAVARIRDRLNDPDER